MKSNQYNKGINKRKKVLGSKYVNKAIKNKNLFSEDFQNFITINCWDKVWNSKFFNKILLITRETALNRNTCIAHIIIHYNRVQNFLND